ncbi:uncharacterized protein B0H18DRAFT_1161959 [Fomitopsis serialis]|uniref:uncharacterized protein n=1 Tax=Fomitopsis serialis TaxID=139415 RepID=UPI0020083DFB|nr:uncharacterized protein B0H18DRAFT_1161959 [Neoantrodia serialis]KAH9927358.1 hypothetical protein B0H18DRAFT_1161959 [Neoantrodia serialis]
MLYTTVTVSCAYSSGLARVHLRRRQGRAWIYQRVSQARTAAIPALGTDPCEWVQVMSGSQRDRGMVLEEISCPGQAACATGTYPDARTFLAATRAKCDLHLAGPVDPQATLRAAMSGLTRQDIDGHVGGRTRGGVDSSQSKARLGGVSISGSELATRTRGSSAPPGIRLAGHPCGEPWWSSSDRDVGMATGARAWTQTCGRGKRRVARKWGRCLDERGVDEGTRGEDEDVSDKGGDALHKEGGDERAVMVLTEVESTPVSCLRAFEPLDAHRTSPSWPGRVACPRDTQLGKDAVELAV